MIESHHTMPLTDRIRHKFDRFINYVEIAGLVLIGLATAFAMAQETWKVLLSGHVSLSDLLLMFLYLEVLAMDGRYLRLGQLPVRFPLYIAMASLARELILRFDDPGDQHMLITTVGIVMLALGILVLRFGQHRYPAADDEGREELYKKAAKAEAAGSAAPAGAPAATARAASAPAPVTTPMAPLPEAAQTASAGRVVIPPQV